MILVTGGTGLLGSHLLFELMKKESKVRCLYRNEEKKKQVKQLFDYYSRAEKHLFDRIEWLQGDLLDLVSLEDAFQGVHTVYHCAGFISFLRKDFKKLIAINRQGTANIVNYSIKYGVQKLGYVSSTATLGDNPQGVITEATKWNNTTLHSGYAVSKYNAEREVWRATQENIPVIIIHPSIILGAGSLDQSSLALLKAVKKGLKYSSTGANAFVDARNVAESLVWLMESTYINDNYLCTGTNTSYADLLKQIATLFQVKAPSICPPRWLAILTAHLIELSAYIGNKKVKLSVESIRAAYNTSVYSDEKLKKKCPIHWYSLEETLQNSKNFADKNII